MTKERMLEHFKEIKLLEPDVQKIIDETDDPEMAKEKLMPLLDKVSHKIRFVAYNVGIHASHDAKLKGEREAAENVVKVTDLFLAKISELKCIGTFMKGPIAEHKKALGHLKSGMRRMRQPWQRT